MTISISGTHIFLLPPFTGTLPKLLHLITFSSLPTPNCSPFVFNQFDVCGVRKSIVSIASNAIIYQYAYNNKGNGSISRIMVLRIQDEILRIIYHILNYSISVNAFPSAWKMAKFIPVPKKCHPSSITDYRLKCL